MLHQCSSAAVTCQVAHGLVCITHLHITIYTVLTPYSLHIKHAESLACRHCVCRHVLKDESEHAMVRHEAAEALGSIASPDCLQLLTDYCRDPEPIVADSCVVSFLVSARHM